MKKIFLIGLTFLILSPALAEEENITITGQALPFGSLQELYQAVKKFSQEELGMPLNFDIPFPDSANQDSLASNPKYYYLLMVCHKLKFWNEEAPLCSLYVCGDTCPWSADDLLRYNLGEYDIWGENIELFSTTWGDKQTAPIIDLSNLDLCVINLETVFHEGFHFYAREKGASAYDTSLLVTIKNRALEESAAEAVGWLAVRLFFMKCCPELYSANPTIKEILNDQVEFGNMILGFYQALDSIYRSDLSDSLKFEESMAIPANNAKLTYTSLYFRYQPLFKNIWYKTKDPKKSIEIFLQIIRDNTQKLQKTKPR